MIDLPYYSYGYAQNFLEVPIGARIYALPGKFKLHFELAEVTSIPLVFNKNQFQEESIMLAGRFGTGIDYFLGRWQWSLTANYGRMFRPISRDSQDLWDQNNLGFEFRTAFHLGKD